MDKNSEGQNSDRGAGRDRPEHDRGFDQNQDREQGGGNRGRGSGGGDFRQNAGENRGQGSGVESKQGVEKSDYHYNQEAEKRAADQLAADTKKSGCFPKVAMLLVPFLALATYVLLRS